MLTTNRDVGLAATSHDNVVDEAGKRRNTPNDKGDNGTPVGGELGRVAVHSVEVVHIRN